MPPSKHFQDIAARRELIAGLLMAIILTIIGGAVAYRVGQLTIIALIVTIITFFLLMAGYCLFGCRALINWLREQLIAQPARLIPAVLAILLPYLIFVIGVEQFSGQALLALIGYLMLPTALLIMAGPTDKQHLRLLDGLAILAVWLPFDLRWITGSAIWPSKAQFAFSTLVAVNLALILFVCYRRLNDVGYHFRPSAKIIVTGLINYALFVPIAIGIGLLTGFLIWLPHHNPLIKVLLTGLGIFFFTAIPEELLFRGIIQNFLIKTLPSRWLAILIASMIFGASHWNNASTIPNKLSYCLLATIAGIFYGRAYLATGALLAGAIAHALVDTTWHELFK